MNPIKNNKTKSLKTLESCNRCCSDKSIYIGEQIVKCDNCGFTDSLEIWQLRGWRDIFKYPPVYSGIIFVYGKNIGRTIAHWDSANQVCDNPLATHWLRTPDPTKQINM